MRIYTDIYKTGRCAQQAGNHSHTTIAASAAAAAAATRIACITLSITLIHTK